MNYTENVIVPERTLLVSLDTGEYDAEESLRELWELAKSVRSGTITFSV